MPLSTKDCLPISRLSCKGGALLMSSEWMSDGIIYVWKRNEQKQYAWMCKIGKRLTALKSIMALPLIRMLSALPSVLFYAKSNGKETQPRHSPNKEGRIPP